VPCRKGGDLLSRDRAGIEEGQDSDEVLCAARRQGDHRKMDRIDDPERPHLESAVSAAANALSSVLEDRQELNRPSPNPDRLAIRLIAS